MTVVEFGSLFEFIRNGMSVRQDKSGEGLPITRIETISEAIVDSSRVGYAGLEEKDCNGWLLQPGDILFSHINSAEHIGKCAVYDGAPEKLVHGMNLLCLRPDKSKLTPQFGKYLIRSSAFRTRLFNYVNKAVNQASVSIGNLKPIEVSVPPLPEQKRIAAILDKADSIRRMRQEAVRLTEELLRSVFLEMFGDPVTNPKGWPFHKINGVCSEIVDCVNRTATIVDYQTPFKMIRTTNVRNYSIDLIDVRCVDEHIFEQWTRRLMPKRGDIVFTREAPVGEAGIIQSDDHVFLGQRTMHFRPDASKATSEYLLFELMGSGVRRQIETMGAGSTVKHLSVPECKEFQVRVPPIKLQKRFTAIVHQSQTMKSKILGSNANTNTLFCSLLQRAFEGGL